MEYQRQGYLAPAVVNFLALLGWSPGEDRELMSVQELIDSFTLEGISGGNAVFNTEKLDWMNGQYIARLPIAELAAAAKPFFDATDLATHPLVTEPRAFHRLLELLRPRAKRLTEFVEQARPLLTEVVTYEPEAVEKHLSSGDLADHIAALVEALDAAMPFDEAQIEAAVRATASARGLKAGALIHATRVAVTGRAQSPGLFDVLAWLGRERTRTRLVRLLDFLSRTGVRQ
jgi:glutamyl-tRNA synthetase